MRILKKVIASSYADISLSLRYRMLSTDFSFHLGFLGLTWASFYHRKFSLIAVIVLLVRTWTEKKMSKVRQKLFVIQASNQVISLLWDEESLRKIKSVWLVTLSVSGGKFSCSRVNRTFWRENITVVGRSITGAGRNVQ